MINLTNGYLEKPFEMPMHHMDVVPRNNAELAKARVSDWNSESSLRDSRSERPRKAPWMGFFEVIQ